MPLSQILSRWRSDPSVAESIEVWRSIPAHPARFAPFPPDLYQGLTQALQSKGIQALYSHQRTAWDKSRLGENIVVVTGTASGKTLCYNLPILDRLSRDPQARALYLFPTRALAQDQFSALQELTGAIQPGDLKFAPAVYDGDTSNSARPAIRKQARIVFSNPDMLHMGILPHHTGWMEFFQHLAYVVIDEMHAYRGVFGSHVCNVMRRLKRTARHYGASPQFILTSATIANPTELASHLVEAPVALIDDDGSARGARHFLVYNPPIVNRDLGLRRSALQESVRLAEDLLAGGVQTILFGRSRRAVELILTYLRQRLGSTDSDHSNTARFNPNDVVRGYRSGYLPAQRREIERALRSGKTRVVVATNALELGIDIGKMGAALMVGYPGTIAGTWQQAGRAGRGEETSLAVMVATADPLDQFLARNPQYLLDRPPEAGLVNPDNPLILLNHIRCASFELPFKPGEGFGSLPSNQVQEYLEFLAQAGELHPSRGTYFWMADQYPAQGVTLRSTSAENILLQSTDDYGVVTIGEVDQTSAHWMVHPGAIYIHEGQTYLVESLDLDQKLAQLHSLETDYYTLPRLDSNVELIDKSEELDLRAAVKVHGEIRVTSQVTGFRKLRWYTHEMLGFSELTLPQTELLTTGYWMVLSQTTVNQLRQQGLWQNDPNDYGPDWRRVREAVRLRDGYCCQSCGVAETNKTHDVHHKTPFRSFRDERGNIDRAAANRLENLVTLCQNCHQKVETAVRIRSGLAGLAFALGHIAPLFLMCDPRDLGVYADPIAPIAQGEPAVVLYDQVPAGIGFSQRLYELHKDLVGRAFDLVSTCSCTDGCPSCVGPGGENGAGGKRETLAILEALVHTEDLPTLESHPNELW